MNIWSRPKKVRLTPEEVRQILAGLTSIQTSMDKINTRLDHIALQITDLRERKMDRITFGPKDR